MHDDINAVLKGPAEVGRGECIVDHQRDTCIVGDFGDPRQVHDLQPRIAKRLPENQPRVWRNRPGKGIGVARINECRRDPEARQCVIEHIVAPAVDRGRRHDVSPLPHQRNDCQMQRRLSGSRRHRTKPAFQRGNPFFHHSHGRVRYPRIDVPRTFQIEQCRGVIRVLKNVGGGLVNRLRPRAGGGIGLLARV